MKRKLNCILLIDDDEPTNFLHTMIIKRCKCTEKIVAVQGGREALDYLSSKEDNEHPQPDLIFLDINMPGMNGWEFLEHYKQLDKGQQGRIVVIMLTTSLNPDDASQAKDKVNINRFMNKPLTVKMIDDVLEEHFSEWR